MPYTSASFVAGLEDLDSRRDLLSHIFSTLFYYRHLVYIVYFRHLAILNYCLALGLPPNILDGDKYDDDDYDDDDDNLDVLLTMTF